MTAHNTRSRHPWPCPTGKTQSRLVSSIFRAVGPGRRPSGAWDIPDPGSSDDLRARRLAREAGGFRRGLTIRPPTAIYWDLSFFKTAASNKRDRLHGGSYVTRSRFLRSLEANHICLGRRRRCSSLAPPSPGTTWRDTPYGSIYVAFTAGQLNRFRLALLHIIEFPRVKGNVSESMRTGSRLRPCNFAGRVSKEDRRRGGFEGCDTAERAIATRRLMPWRFGRHFVANP